MAESPTNKDLFRVDITKATKDDPYWLSPGSFCLAETRECFNLPDDISAQFVLKSSRAREGLIIFLLVGAIQAGTEASSRSN
jgi:dCTP deaminase